MEFKEVSDNPLIRRVLFRSKPSQPNETKVSFSPLQTQEQSWSAKNKLSWDTSDRSSSLGCNDSYRSGGLFSSCAVCLTGSGGERDGREGVI